MEMYFEHIFSSDYVEKIKGRALDSEEKAEMKQLYETVTRKELNRTCADCYLDAWFVLKKLYSSNEEYFMKLLTGVARLKAGVVLDHNGGHVTNFNLTDELAISILEKSPGAAKFLAVLPISEQKETKKRKK